MLLVTTVSAVLLKTFTVSVSDSSFWFPYTLQLQRLIVVNMLYYFQLIYHKAIICQLIFKDFWLQLWGRNINRWTCVFCSTIFDLYCLWSTNIFKTLQMVQNFKIFVRQEWRDLLQQLIALNQRGDSDFPHMVFFGLGMPSFVPWHSQALHVFHLDLNR